MENKTVLIVVALVLAYLLFIRKPTARVVAGVSPGVVPNPTSPKPAMPQPSTAQIALAAGINAAPQAIQAIGSFFSNDDTSGGYDDSSQFSDYSSDY